MQTGIPKAGKRNRAVLGLDFGPPALFQPTKIVLGRGTSKSGQAAKKNVLALQRLVERRHERLLQGQHVAAGLEIVPAFQPVIDGQDERAVGRGLVGQKPYAHALGNLFHRRFPGAIVGIVVRRVDVPEDCSGELARGHLVDQFLEVVGRGQRGRGLLAEHGDALGTEYAVQDVASNVRLDGCSRAGEDHGLVAGGAQILDQCIQLRGEWLGFGQALQREGVQGRKFQARWQGAASFEMNGPNQREGDAAKGRRANRYAHVGLGSGQTHAALEDVEAIHRSGRRVGAAHAREARDGRHGVAKGSKEVGLESDDDFRSIEMIPS